MCFVIRGMCRQITQNRPVCLPMITARQSNLQGSGDPATRMLSIRIFSQRQFQPLRNAVALNEKNFVFQWLKRVLA